MDPRRPTLHLFGTILGMSRPCYIFEVPKREDTSIQYNSK